MKTRLCSLLLLITSFSYAQSVEINPAGAGGSIITSTANNKGMLVSRMTAAERSAISTPANGLLVYQTDGVAGFYFYNGTAWTVLGGGSGSQGPAGLNTLVKTTTEAAGANCTTGGVKLEYGLDANSNNTLDAGEIVAALTKYICNGAVGQQGATGKAVLNGTTNPAAGTGTDGDFYINTTASTLFGPKAGGIWPAGVALVGAAGAAGTNGKTVLNGTTTPSAGTGTDGDFYINTATNTLFGPKTSGAWPAGVALVGAAGAAGQGVPTGGTANQVLAKIDGTNYNTQWVTPASGGSDNLGNHTATQALNMANNNITNVNTATTSKLNTSEISIGSTTNSIELTQNSTGAQIDATGKSYIYLYTTTNYYSIHGISGGYDGKILYLGIYQGLTLVIESTTETVATNRISNYFIFPPAQNLNAGKHLIKLMYMSSVNGGRWVIIDVDL